MVSFEDKGLGPPGVCPGATPSALPAHTPGPWHIQKGFRSIYSLSHGDSGLTTFITKPEGHQCGEDQADANARLIAAAPDMLAALIAMEAEKADYMRINHLGDPAQQHTNKMARAAIAKATGQ